MSRKEENEAEALNYLDKVMDTVIKEKKKVSYPSLVKEVIITYSVSQYFVEKSIKFFYLNTNMVLLEDNVLRGSK